MCLQACLRGKTDYGFGQMCVADDDDDADDNNQKNIMLVVQKHNQHETVSAVTCASTSRSGR